MENEQDFSSMSVRLGEAFEAVLPPEFVHAKHSPGVRPGWTELSFPSGLVCTTNSIPVETEHMYNEIFKNRVYLASGIAVADGDTIVDVGANIGMFAMFILSNYVHATVHCIEPVPANFKILQKNVERYPHHDVRLHNTALGGEADGLAGIIHYPHLTGNSTVHPETGEV